MIRMIKSRRMIWAGHIECMGNKRKVYRILVGKLEGKRPLERPRPGVGNLLVVLCGSNIAESLSVPT
jgi:hypothetical protein